MAKTVQEQIYEFYSVPLSYIGRDLFKMAKVAANEAGVTPKEALDIFLDEIKKTDVSVFGAFNKR